MKFLSVFAPFAIVFLASVDSSFAQIRSLYSPNLKSLDVQSGKIVSLQFTGNPDQVSDIDVGSISCPDNATLNSNGTGCVDAQGQPVPSRYQLTIILSTKYTNNDAKSSFALGSPPGPSYITLSSNQNFVGANQVNVV